MNRNKIQLDINKLIGALIRTESGESGTIGENCYTHATIPTKAMFETTINSVCMCKSEKEIYVNLNEIMYLFGMVFVNNVLATPMNYVQSSSNEIKKEPDNEIDYLLSKYDNSPDSLKLAMYMHFKRFFNKQEFEERFNIWMNMRSFESISNGSEDMKTTIQLYISLFEFYMVNMMDLNITNSTFFRNMFFDIK